MSNYHHTNKQDIYIQWFMCSCQLIFFGVFNLSLTKYQNHYSTRCSLLATYSLL